ncbi:MAG TPA: hypothetical protein VGE60_00235 [Telluria sp.]
MAVQEVAKHTKKAIQAAGDSSHGLGHKLREVALEIFIIVFAVTLSFWLHGLGEHQHEQQQVKSFLHGLKRDIQSDLEQIDSVVKSHHKFDENYRYLASLDPATPPDTAKFDAAYEMISTNSFLVPQVSRYEGFKSSGKLINIEDADLLQKIVSLYQFDIPKAELSFGGWKYHNSRLTAYLEENIDDADTREGRLRALTAPKGKRLLKRMQTYPQLYERYDTVASKGKDIIQAIDKAYPEG